MRRLGERSPRTNDDADPTQDLSLLTHLSHDDIQNLQTVGKDAQAARSKFILKDDQSAVWEHLRTLRNAQVDFVLDNCEFILRSR